MVKSVKAWGYLIDGKLSAGTEPTKELARAIQPECFNEKLEIVRVMVTVIPKKSKIKNL